MSIRASLVASAALALSALVALPGCNFILNPEGDGVLRCDNADECDVPLAEYLADGRGQSRCDNAGGGPGSFTQGQDNKVCSVVDKEDVSCNPEAYPEGTPLHDKYVKAAASDVAALIYAECDDGSEGCKPAGGACQAGLVKRTYKTLYASSSSKDPEVQEVTICAKEGSDAVGPNLGIRGLDVLDQHCRSYFCDEDFVCNLGNPSGARCIRCDPNKPYGQGGCGTMYLRGARSSVYVDAECPAKADAENTAIGDVVVP
ncbi:MAG TPA: hypothetical protein VIK91_01260 [Nannocystis sp.]